MIIKHLKLVTLADAPSAVSSVIPDCCNIGVIYRVLLATNATIFCAIWMQSIDTPNAVRTFFDSAMVLQTICILSLIMLCGLRKVALVQQCPDWLQRLLCGIIPGLIAIALSGLISTQAWLFGELVHASPLQMGVLAALFGILFQQHFELRARAFSPALGEAKLQALQARIRPHFLFNSMNAVLSLIRTDPHRAEAALEDLADLFRVLMRDTRDVSTLQEELQLCHQYLSIEQIRLGDRLKVEWEISNLSEQDIEQGQISSLLLQPLIENAVHHGVEPSQFSAVINIRLNRDGDRIYIVIENPYIPDHASKGNQMALNNIRERLKLLYDVEAKFTAEAVGNQFQVKMSFPFRKTSGQGSSHDPHIERRKFKRIE
ncbi:two-component system sensor histidine kinase AlgZ [Oxalobacteraceae bacterium GrIS 1.18]